VAYRKQDPTAVEKAHYDALISGAIRFKVWTYLTLGKLYGQAVYFDDAEVSLDKISELPLVRFEELIPKLITLMETGFDGVNGLFETNWGDILYPGVPSNQQDLVWNMICPAPSPLRMELYLWNQVYQKVVEIGVPFISDGGGKKYKVSNEDWNGEWVQFFTRDPITRTRGLITIV